MAKKSRIPIDKHVAGHGVGKDVSMLSRAVARRKILRRVCRARRDRPSPRLSDARSTESEAIAAKQLTMDEARRIAVSIARLLELEKSETRPWVGLRSISRAILRRRKPMRVHPR